MLHRCMASISNAHGQSVFQARTCG
jgi:hypothetical protein